MHVLIAGGCGFLGRELTRALTAAGHQVTILTRRAVTGAARTPSPQMRLVTWIPDGDPGPWARACEGVDAVINLAGESIGTKRWSAVRKAELIVSRIKPTRSLVRFIDGASPRPSVFLSSSAIGYYGDRGEDVLTEDARDGTDFLAELACEWEKEAQRAAVSGTRVVLLRTGIVLDPREGALAKMLLPFRLFAGGPFGAGRQYMAWIHRDDWIALVGWLLATSSASGPFNLVAPMPVANREFAAILGRVLRRPALVPAPSFALKLLLGEMAGPLLLSSQRVVPAKAQAAGFTFAFPTLEAALRDLLEHGSGARSKK